MEKLIRKILKETTTTKAGFKAFDNVVNMYMKKKYPWWINIETSGFSYSKHSIVDFVMWHALITVDSSWYNDLCLNSIYSDCETEHGVGIELMIKDNDLLDKLTKDFEKIYLLLNNERKLISIRRGVKLIPDKKIY